MQIPFVPKSEVFGIHWPAFVGDKQAQSLALSFQLERSQWLSSEQLIQLQRLQLGDLLRHAVAAVPHYRRTFASRGVRVPAKGAFSEALESIPILTRPQLQQADSELSASDLPPAHGRSWESMTSGSTGRPVRTRQTDATDSLWKALVLRDHFWHRRDATSKLATIRWSRDQSFGPPPDGSRARTWGHPYDLWMPTGPSAALSLTANHETQLEWLVREDPVYLTTYPTNLVGLARAALRVGKRPRHLRQIMTVSETVTEEIRQVAEEAFGAPLVDAYSAFEVGYIAIQCPDHGHYHVQAETVLVEVLDADDRPCQPGQVGRVVVTQLHNYATPLIRYEIGDYAEVGEPCECGRGLPVLRRILGRTRNMLVLPNGDTFWPVLSSKECRAVMPYSQMQLVQKTRESIEVRLAIDEEPTDAQRSALTRVLQDSLHHPFEIQIRIVGEIQRSRSGKFEEFMSEVSPEEAGGVRG